MDIKDILFRIWQEKNINKSEHKNAIGEDATEGTRDSQEFITDLYYNRNKQVRTWLDNKGYTVGDLTYNPATGGFTITPDRQKVQDRLKQKSDEIGKDIQQKAASGELVIDPQGKWKEEYYKKYGSAFTIYDPVLTGVNKDGTPNFEIQVGFDADKQIAEDNKAFQK